MTKQTKKKVTEEVKTKSTVNVKKVNLTKDYFAICDGKEIKGSAGQTIEMPESHYNKTVIYYIF